MTNTCFLLSAWYFIVARPPQDNKNKLSCPKLASLVWIRSFFSSESAPLAYCGRRYFHVIATPPSGSRGCSTATGDGSARNPLFFKRPEKRSRRGMMRIKWWIRKGAGGEASATYVFCQIVWKTARHVGSLCH
jgi:hypothetical protein